MARILILGGGSAGTMLANHLCRLKKNFDITVIEPDEYHLYQPGLLFLPFGETKEEKILRKREKTFLKPVHWVKNRVKEVQPEKRTVILEDNTQLTYDVLVIATGAHLDFSETEGLLEKDWYIKRFDFYTLEGAKNLQKALKNFHSGTLVVNVIDMPIKCPVAPLEFVFLADAYFRKKGVRKNVQIKLVTPLDGAFTKPIASKMLQKILEQKNIEIITEFNTGRVEDRELVSWDERRVAFDLLVVIPLHSGAAFLKNTDLVDDLGFVRVNKHTLQQEKYPEIFALGDVTNVPASKAGSVAHFEAEGLAQNIVNFISGKPLVEDFDGHANCFIETGQGKATLIDFSYDTEPLPGKYPHSVLGPFSLLKINRINHWGKLAFRYLYWNFLLPAKYLPIERHYTKKGKFIPQE